MGVTSHRKAEIYVQRVAVPINLRGLGYGEKLVNAAIELANSLSQEECGWISMAAFSHLVPWYERFGFWDMTANDDGDSLGRLPYSCTRMEMRNEPKGQQKGAVRTVPGVGSPMRRFHSPNGNRGPSASACNACR